MSAAEGGIRLAHREPVDDRLRVSGCWSADRGLQRMGRRMILLPLVALAVSACGGSGMPTVAKRAFPFPTSQPVTANTPQVATANWENTIQTAVQCSFVSSDPVSVAASAATYGV